MKNIIGFLSIFTLLACTTPRQQQDTVPEATTSRTDTVLEKPDQRSSISYVGRIWHFYNTQTFYTDLHFADHVDDSQYENITALGEGVTYDEDETRRTYISADKGAGYFNLTGLNKIDIYNKDNVKVAEGDFSHIEYVETLIETKFVAVFNVSNKNLTDPLFCIGNPTKTLTPLAYQSYTDESLTKKLLAHVPGPGLLNTQHYKLPDQSIYSIVSTYTTAYIFLTRDGESKTVYTSKENETITSLMITSLLINTMPVLLTDSGMPETDMTWNSLLIFDGKEYRVSPGSRL